MFSRVLEVAAFEAFSYVCNQTVSAISRIDFKNNILTLYHAIGLPLHKLKQVDAACINQSFGELTQAYHAVLDPHAIESADTTHTHLVPCGLFNSTHLTSFVQQIRKAQYQYGVTLLNNADSHGLLKQFSAYEATFSTQLAERYQQIEHVLHNNALWQQLRLAVKADIFISIVLMAIRNELIKKGFPKRFIDPLITAMLTVLITLESGSLDMFRLNLLMLLISKKFMPDSFSYHKELMTSVTIAFMASQQFNRDSSSYCFTAVKMLATTAVALLTRYVVNGMYEQLSSSFRFFNSLPEHANIILIPDAVLMERRGM